MAQIVIDNSSIELSGMGESVGWQWTSMTWRRTWAAGTWGCVALVVMIGVLADTQRHSVD